MPNICVEELEVPPGDAEVVALDDDELPAATAGRSQRTAAATTTNPMNVRLLCFTAPPL